MDSGDSVLYPWAMQRVVTYQAVLESCLDHIHEGAALSTLLEKAMYAAAGLSRVGLDFRGLLVPMFEGAVLRLWSRGVEAALSTFERALKAYHFIPSPKVTSRLDDIQRTGGAPLSLLDFPPLALFSNRIVESLNELRECAPLALRDAVGEVLLAGLHKVATATAEAEKQERTQGETEAAHLRTCAARVATDCAPYLAGALQQIYPSGPALNTSAALEPLSTLLNPKQTKPVEEAAVHEDAGEDKGRDVKKEGGDAGGVADADAVPDVGANGTAEVEVELPVAQESREEQGAGEVATKDSGAELGLGETGNEAGTGDEGGDAVTTDTGAEPPADEAKTDGDDEGEGWDDF